PVPQARIRPSGLNARALTFDDSLTTRHWRRQAWWKWCQVKSRLAGGQASASSSMARACLGACSKAEATRSRCVVSPVVSSAGRQPRRLERGAARLREVLQTFGVGLALLDESMQVVGIALLPLDGLVERPHLPALLVEPVGEVQPAAQQQQRRRQADREQRGR